MVVLLVIIQELHCTNFREFTYVPSCRGKLVFDSSRLQEGIFVYTLVNCTIKLTFAFVTHANNNNDNKLRKLLFV